MTLTPLKAYRTPDYPTKEALRQRPELLRTLPRRWHNNPIVLGALAGLLGLMEQSVARAEDQPTLRVAPVFLHGEGVAAFGGAGGIVRAMLTEAEAREVIEEEAKKAGIEFAGCGHKLDGVPLPITDEFAFLAKLDQDKGKKPDATKKKSQNGDLILTGWNIRKKVGYKFVARSDFEAWERKDMGLKSTVSEFDLLDAAQRLQAGLEKVKEPGTVAVFYEPATSGPKNLKQPSMFLPYDPNDKSLSEKEIKTLKKKEEETWDAYQAAAQEEDKKELRLQVRDFLAWLKAQGVM